MKKFICALFNRPATAVRPPATRARLGLEPLDRRDVPAVIADWWWTDRVLTITGDGADNAVKLSTSDDGYIRVDGAVGDTRLPWNSVNAVVFLGQGGNDRFENAMEMMIPTTVDGGDGDDVLESGYGNDALKGGRGDDTYVFNTMDTRGSDTIVEVANNGSDTLKFSGGWALSINLNAPTLSNSSDGNVAGTVRLQLQSGQIENVYGGSGHDTIVGNGANNLLAGGGGRDDIFGMGGDDDLYGERGNDILHGGDGNDTLWGQEGNDWLNGDWGNDVLHGGTGNDTLGATVSNGVRITEVDTSTNKQYRWDVRVLDDPGNDWMCGDDGEDVIRGGTGVDTLYGGAGNDTLGAVEMLFRRVKRRVFSFFDVQWETTDTYIPFGDDTRGALYQ